MNKKLIILPLFFIIQFFTAEAQWKNLFNGKDFTRLEDFEMGKGQITGNTKNGWKISSGHPTGFFFGKKAPKNNLFFPFGQTLGKKKRKF